MGFIITRVNDFKYSQIFPVKKHRFLPFILLPVLSLFTLYCSKGPGQDASTRHITGTALVTDEYGMVSGGMSGVTVRLSNGIKDVTTQSGQGGKFTFAYVPFGTYRMEYSLPGYGTMKYFGIQHPKRVDSVNIPLQLEPMGISQKSSTQVTWFDVQPRPNGGIGYWMNSLPVLTLSGVPRHYRLFVSRDSLVSDQKFEFTTLITTYTGSNGTGEFNGLPRADWPAGTKAWIRLYGDSSPHNMYMDSTTGKWVFPCLNNVTVPAKSILVQ